MIFFQHGLRNFISSKLIADINSRCRYQMFFRSFISQQRFKIFMKFYSGYVFSTNSSYFMHVQANIIK